MGYNKPIKVNGVTYESVKAAAESYGKSVSKFRDRIRYGWTPEQALDLELPPTFAHKERNLTFEGKTYSNMKELAEAYGLTGNKVRRRIDRNEWSLRQALDIDPPPKNRGRKDPVIFQGKTYRNRPDLARAFNIDPKNLGARLSKGWTLEQALEVAEKPKKQSWRRDAKVIENRAYPQGKSGHFSLYLITCVPSKKEYVGVTTGSLEKRWGEHVSAAIHSGKTKSKLYRAIKKYGVEAFKITLLRSDASDYRELLIQEYMEVAKRDTFKNGYNSTFGGETTGAARNITVAGKNFPTLTSAANFYDVDEAVVRSRIDVLGWTSEEAVGVAPRPTDWGPNEVILEGKTYPSLKDAAKHYGLTYSKIHLRITKYNWTLEQAFELEMRKGPSGSPKKITFKGNTYRSNSALARAYNIKPELFLGRIGKGWTLEEALGLKEREKQNDYNSISITIRGKTFKSLKAAAKIYGINYKLVSSRLISGWDVDEAFELVARKKKGK